MMKQKHALVAVLGALLMGFWSPAAQAQTENGERKIIYAVSTKKADRCAIWVDAIEFGKDYTTVQMHYAEQRGRANLMPSTTLVCHLKGGETKVLTLRSTRGISMVKDHYTPLRRGEVFTALFSPLLVGDVARIKSIDLLEDAGSLSRNKKQNLNPGVFNILGIRIDRKHQLVR